MEYIARNSNKTEALNKAAIEARISIKEIYNKKGKKETTLGVKINTDIHDLKLLQGLAEFECDKKCLFDGQAGCTICSLAKFAKSIRLVDSESEFINDVLGLTEDEPDACPTPNIPCDACGHYNFSNKDGRYKCDLGLEETK